jgi:phosphoribosyl 1,2-cyclic phosphodiesterase
MRVTFWGVRGTVPCPSSQHLAFGGNTSCVQVEAGDVTIILDAGTGIRRLGQTLMRRGLNTATLLVTHAHHDHINGFPFFAPLFSPDWHVRVVSGPVSCANGLYGALDMYVAAPLFPVPLARMPSTFDFSEVTPGDKFMVGSEVRVQTASLNHPDGATGYRIENGGFSIAYVTDTEHVPGTDDENVLKLIEGCELVIYDSTFTSEEFPTKVGWGHSTWAEGVRLCRLAGAKRLALFHHDPSHDDETMAAIERDAQGEWTQAFAAREGMSIALR